MKRRLHRVAVFQAAGGPIYQEGVWQAAPTQLLSERCGLRGVALSSWLWVKTDCGVKVDVSLMFLILERVYSLTAWWTQTIQTNPKNIKKQLWCFCLDCLTHFFSVPSTQIHHQTWPARTFTGAWHVFVGKHFGAWVTYEVRTVEVDEAGDVW